MHRGKLEGRNVLGELGVDGSIILKKILKRGYEVVNTVMNLRVL
jgi:hypothetical protein